MNKVQFHNDVQTLLAPYEESEGEQMNSAIDREEFNRQNLSPI